MYADMGNWAEIRRRVLVDDLSKRAACREHESHWDMLQKILSHPGPPGYRHTAPRPKPKLEPFLPVIQPPVGGRVRRAGAPAVHQGARSGVHGGSRCSITFGGMEGRLARCQPALSTSTTSSFAPSGSIHRANAAAAIAGCGCWPDARSRGHRANHTWPGRRRRAGGPGSPRSYGHEIGGLGQMASLIP